MYILLPRRIILASSFHCDRYFIYSIVYVIPEVLNRVYYRDTFLLSCSCAWDEIKAVVCGFDSSSSDHNLVMVCCEYGNEFSGFVKGNFLSIPEAIRVSRMSLLHGG
jgi:hypothetical protein